MPRETSKAPLSSDPLIALLEHAHVTRSSLIRVTGANGLPVMMWLCRHGFDRVGYVKSSLGCGHEHADALLVAHPCEPAALQRLLIAGPHVREGGVLILQSPLPEPGAPFDPVHRLLEASGYSVEACHHGQRREVHIARRQAFGRLAKAA